MKNSKALIHDHSLFFDKLIELIPAKFYLPSNESKPWFQGLNKPAKAAAKQQTRENIKKARCHRFDPENSQSSILELLKQNIEKEKKSVRPVADDLSVTYEELRQRLHRRIEELHGNRSRGERSRFEKGENKRKRGDDGLEEKGGRDGKAGSIGKSENKIVKDAEEAAKGIAFGKVKLVGEGEEEEGGRKKKRKLSKAKELERARKLEEAKRDPEKGAVVANKHSWTAAVSRAAGVKVHDDPKLLKKSMHKEKKRHDKNVEMWKGRVDSREKMKKVKQTKRAGNISERIHQKKMRKIAKREKKLMRPGFEGRKQGYIN